VKILLLRAPMTLSSAMCLLHYCTWDSRQWRNYNRCFCHLLTRSLLRLCRWERRLTSLPTFQWLLHIA